MSTSELQATASRFKNGNDFLRQWENDADLREEFDNSFESWCHYAQAYNNGQVRMCGRRGGA